MWLFWLNIHKSSRLQIVVASLVRDKKLGLPRYEIKCNFSHQDNLACCREMYTALQDLCTIKFTGAFNKTLIAVVFFNGIDFLTVSCIHPLNKKSVKVNKTFFISINMIVLSVVISKFIPLLFALYPYSQLFVTHQTQLLDEVEKNKRLVFGMNNVA